MKKSHISSNIAKFSSFLSTIAEFPICSFLKKSGFYHKSKGIPVVGIFLEMILCIIIGKSIFSFLTHGCHFIQDRLSKSTVYRFLENTSQNWRRLVQLFSFRAISVISPATSEKTIRTLIIDDSVFKRNRSKATEYLSRIFDHANHVYLKGYFYLLLCWSDGITTLPLDFVLVASRKDKNCYNVPEHVDTRTSAGKRQAECRKKKPELVLDMLNRFVAAAGTGVQRATHLLCDSWFTTAPFICSVRELGFHVVGMLKHMNNAEYKLGDRYLSIKVLLEVLKRQHKLNMKKDIVGSVIVETKVTKNAKTAHRVKLVFIRNRTQPDNILTILSTDLDLSDEEIVKLYARRWAVEEIFFAQKQHLHLSKTMAKKYASIVAHTSLVCIATILLEYQRRTSSDHRTAGELFRQTEAEIRDIPLCVALDTLMNVFFDFIKELKNRDYIKKGKFSCVEELAHSMISSWFKGLDSYIRDFLALTEDKLGLKRI